MKNEGFEFSTKQLKIILSVGTALFAIILFFKFFILNTDEKSLEDSLKNIKEENFKGFVIDKNYDKDNHNSPTIYFKDKTKITVFGEFWSKIMIGDSLEKKSGETIITVYRNNEKFILDNKDIINSFNKK